MPTLFVRRGDTRTKLSFRGTPTLSQVLAEGGFALPSPCGGRGVCGKCATSGLSGAVSPPDEAERRAGVRLACQARLLGDCELTLPPAQQWTAIETGGARAALGHPMAGRYGAAVDLGTTTVAARVFDLQTGDALGEHTLLNPQTAVSADVMGRISAALAGGLGKLRQQAVQAVEAAVEGACANAGVPAVDALTLTGNTTMLYLLTGRSPDTLAHAPFQADWLSGEETVLRATALAGATLYLPPCAGAFIGADIVCAALAIGLTDDPGTVLLMDIGTNGELLLRHRGALFAASAPAGPAFEGGEISQGCGSVQGAIDSVWVEGAGLGARVIGGGQAVGVCGSGLIDAVAALLQLGHIDATGASDAPAFRLHGAVSLTAADIRAVQLAKAAVAAGVETLLDAAHATLSDIGRLELAGGFGSRLNIQSAAAIGLIPATLSTRAHAVGNAALTGAAALLLDTRLRERAQTLARQTALVPLGGDAGFEARFIAAMGFPCALDGDA